MSWHREPRICPPWDGAVAEITVDAWLTDSIGQFVLLVTYSLIPDQLILSSYVTADADEGVQVKWECAELSGALEWEGDFTSHWPWEELQTVESLAHNEPLKLALSAAQLQARSERVAAGAVKYFRAQHLSRLTESDLIAYAAELKQELAHVEQ